MLIGTADLDGVTVADPHERSSYHIAEVTSTARPNMGLHDVRRRSRRRLDRVVWCSQHALRILASLAHSDL